MRNKSWGQLFVLAMLVILVCAVPALAADAHAGGEKKDPLDFSGYKRWDLGIYTVVVFIALLVIIIKFAWPKISEGLEKRETNIRSALDEARKDRADAADLLARAKKELSETAAKIEAMFTEARQEAEALRLAETDKGVKDAQAERDRAKREATAEKEANLKEVQKQAVELAMLIAVKAIRQQLSINDQQKLLEESIAELQANANLA